MYTNGILPKLSLDKIYYVLNIIPAIASLSYILLSGSSDHRRKIFKKLWQNTLP